MSRGQGWTQLLALAAASMLVAAGCGVARVVEPAEDSLATWSERPLAPDPALAALALAEQSACVALGNAGMARILVQDRRMPNTAAFLVSGPTFFASCLVTRDGSSRGGSGPALDPMSGPLTIDNNGEGEVGDGSVRMLGGRVAAGVSRALVEFVDGGSVPASTAGGYWLAWWPDARLARSIVSVDAAGAIIARVEVQR